MMHVVMRALVWSVLVFSFVCASPAWAQIVIEERVEIQARVGFHEAEDGVVVARSELLGEGDYYVRGSGELRFYVRGGGSYISPLSGATFSALSTKGQSASSPLTTGLTLTS